MAAHSATAAATATAASASTGSVTDSAPPGRLELGRSRASRSRATGVREHGHEHAFEMARPDLRDPVVSAERQLLQAALQFPSLIDPARLRVHRAPDSFSAPAHRAVHDAIRAAGGIEAASNPVSGLIGSVRPRP